MSNLTRFLPIIGIAVGGVLAMKVITSAGVLPDVFHKAEAAAAVAHAKDKPAKAGKTGSEKADSDDPTNAFSASASSTQQATTADSMAKDAAAVAPATPAPAPICATSVKQLADEAGVSQGEIQTLQNLGARRQQLDAREAQLNGQTQLMQAAGDKLDSRITQLTALKQQIQGLIDQASKTQSDDTNRLIAVYSAMKPQAAAQVMTTMDDEVRLPIAAGMKDRALAAILAVMTPDAARALTEKLANRMKGSNTLQQKLNSVTQAAPANAAQAQAQASADAASSAAASSAAPAKPATANADAKKGHARARPAALKAKPKPAPTQQAKAADPAQLAAAKSSTAGAPIPAGKPAAAAPAPAPAKPAAAAPSAPAGLSK